ncbi:MAG: hypothetical protein ACRD9R_19185 [Pyrinomonadaceae bacterium]
MKQGKASLSANLSSLVPSGLNLSKSGLGVSTNEVVARRRRFNG